MLQSNIRRYLKHGTLPQLRVFEASVRLGSLARAAEELHMAPPTASVQIKKLTETIGVPLLEQVGKRMYPTQVGRRVFEGCNEVFRAFGSLEEALQDLKSLGGGELDVVVVSSARYFAPRLLGAFAQQHPAMRTSLAILNTSEVMERLRRNQGDVYLLADAAPSGEMVIQSVVANPLVVVARADHPLAARRNIPFAALAREPFLMREPGSGTRAAALRVFASHGLAPATRMELSRSESIREAIHAGLGISILSRHGLGVEPERVGLVCLDVEGFPIESHWQFVYPLGKHLSAGTRAFLEFARAEARTLARQSIQRAG